MIRTPSAVRDYDAYFSGDSAFEQPPTPAEGDEYNAYQAKLTAARETGDWSPLLIAGQVPTKFVLGQVDRTTWRAVTDRAILPADNPRHIGPISMPAIVFRLAVKSIVGMDAFKRQRDERWDGWIMAPASVVDQLDDIDLRIVNEISDQVFSRLRGVSPKS